MNSDRKKALEEELRSSQIYKTLTSTGGPVAEKIAQGLNRAAEEIDKAIGGNASGAGKNRNANANGNAGGYYQRYTQGPAPGPGQQTPPPRQDRGQYRYQYPGTPQQGQQAPSGGMPPPVQQPAKMKVVRRGSPAKYYATAAAALLFAMNGQMYLPHHYILYGVLLTLVFFGARALFKGKKEWVPAEETPPQPQPVKEPEKKEPEKEEDLPDTGDPEVNKIIRSGRDYLKKLRAANDAIPDEALTEDITRMEKASADIFSFIADHPKKAPQIRKFMNYYLPTTLKLLNSYQRLSAQSARGENITSTMFNIAGMMHTVADAFEKQLDSLFTDEAMDVSADISVFETLLKQEGFVEDVKPQTKTREE